MAKIPVIIFSLFCIFFALNARAAEIASVQYVNEIIAALKGSANGLASLDINQKIPIAQIPTGTSAATVALGNDSRMVNAVQTTGTYTMAGTYTITGVLNVATPPLPPVQ